MSTMIREAPTPPIDLPAGFGLLPQENSWPSGLACRLARAWAERRRQRIALRGLAEIPHLLTDVGLTRAHALDEAAKPFWRA
jgi:uncharacterized protein YjiS (DUF1127 family)